MEPIFTDKQLNNMSREDLISLMKTALYVATVARTYRKAIDDYLENPEKYEENMDWYRDQRDAVGKAGFFEVLPCDRDAFFVIFYCGNLCVRFAVLCHENSRESYGSSYLQDSLWLFHL